MIKYYAYYNYGGYKDLWLGTSEDTVEDRYFLPLLPVYEADEDMQDRLLELKALPPIIYLSNQTEGYSYPLKARVMMSHAGYKLQYRRIGNLDVFALRDISGGSDVYGRSCPFAMMFVADTQKDKDNLKKIAWYIWNHLNESELFLSSLFVNDFNVNGLRFGVKLLNAHISDILASDVGSIEDDGFDRPVPFFVASDGLSFANAFKEQQISKKDVAHAWNQSRTVEYLCEKSETNQEPEEHSPDFEPSEFPESGREGMKNKTFFDWFSFVRREDLKPLQDSIGRQEKIIGNLEKRLAEAEAGIIELETRISELTNDQK